MVRSSLALLPLSLLATVVSATSYDVTVGKDGKLKFNPDSLTAYPGDTITYHFYAKNHSVVQSSFDDPCHPSKTGGFFSGFTPVASETDVGPTTWSITVNDTKPLWIYCSQGDHCQNGMVQAVNAPATGNTLDAYRQKAAGASKSSSPGNLPVGGIRLTQVKVGDDGLVFNPSNFKELERTVVRFNFNPANHSVVQSSFDDPCHPLAGGFSSGFVPTKDTPSGVAFDLVVSDSKPVWFYCAQTAKSHCQAGMVGSVNAPDSGNTFDVFKDKASKASGSTIPPNAPLGGVLSVNGTVVTDLAGAVLDGSAALDPAFTGAIPEPGAKLDPYLAGMAGGAQPASYGWGANLTDDAAGLLQLLQLLDDVLVTVLFDGRRRLAAGEWVYPDTVADTIGTMAAQALVHRATATDSLQHFGRKPAERCGGGGGGGGGYANTRAATVDDFLQTAHALLLLEVGLLIDTMARTAPSDPWLVPALASTLGAKSRMAALASMMQGHKAAAAPREALVPAELVLAYVAGRFATRDGCAAQVELASARRRLPAFTISGTDKVRGAAGLERGWGEDGSDRTVGLTLDLDDGTAGAARWMAYLGPWGGLESEAIEGGKVAVPGSLHGHVWAVITKSKVDKVRDLSEAAVAGPELLWVAQS